MRQQVIPINSPLKTETYGDWGDVPTSLFDPVDKAMSFVQKCQDDSLNWSNKLRWVQFKQSNDLKMS